ncbi:MAG TPA: hydantoinase/oxoprolinase family protein [Thermoanaerobaculia bacterium]|jgi:5-oxoprolinase (ATP-hydrolysing)|nr:hydantoinase/oxoprolinase family protein [Thermoanaerobaculia bacterium]
MRAWRLWIDTGGTFTDCLAVDPGGRLHRAKVLSTSALRGRIAERLGPATLQIEAGWSVPDGFLRGFKLRLLSEATPRKVTDQTGMVLELDGPVEGAGAFELRSPEEAPILAARLVTGTPLSQPLPEIAMRLATTRGTNALLERKGSPTALFITRGFADLLLIGTQQRPDLFALDIERPQPLYQAVVEVEERLASNGAVLTPLDAEGLREKIGDLHRAGIRSAAVALMHSYRNPEHEEAVGELLREAAFRHVSLSSRLAPLIKLLPRAETAVVDAYLSPILEGYLNRVAKALSRGTLHVMTSAGGLVRAGSFHAKDSLLSGPAGGVVGAALSGRRSGFSRIIAFDMGGTSTDVARYDGDFEYLFEHRVGDAHLVAPALAVESVAAGGGSICGFDGGQLHVGPESAGAWPGPACYGAGGPLTLTDVNLLLGRLDPDRFEIPLDAEAAERALEGLGEEREALLEGFLEIANERMAEAIRSISLRRGYDPAEYALVAFGGAGAQHACALAELLGIGHVVVPQDAGLLSALGLGAAVVERFAHRQILEPLASVADRLSGWLDELGREAAEAVAAEGIPGVVRRRIVNLRFVGQDEALPIEGEPFEDAFAIAYREIYGYAPEGRAIEVESLRVVASSAEEEISAEAVEARPAVSGTRRCWMSGSWSDVPVYDRAQLSPGEDFPGPALVFESHSATVVAGGWQGRVDGAGNLVLSISGGIDSP